MKVPRLLVAASPLPLLIAVQALPAASAPLPRHATAASAPGTRPDFDGDGAPDLAIGAANRVVVRYGGSRPAQTLTFVSRKGFGEQLAAGDFDGDGYDDLAVGGTRARQRAGEVRVFWGHADGLAGGSASEPQVITATTIGGTTTPGDELGVVAAGDLNGDGVDDLAIGVPLFSPIGWPRSGMAYVLPGSPGKPLLSVTPVAVSQSTVGVPGTPEADDRFGAALAVGDVTGDGTADLVAAAPGENGTGMVQVVPGQPDGPSGAGSTAVAGTSIPGLTASRLDGATAASLGSSLAVADVTGDGRADVVAGAPDARVQGRDRSGGIAVLAASGMGIDAGRAAFLTQDTDGVVGAAERDDRFGAALAVGDLDADAAPEVVVGVPGEAVGHGYGKGSYAVLRTETGGVVDAGYVATVRSDATGRPGAGSSAVDGTTFGVTRLGRGLAARPAAPAAP